jgi:3-hydroxyisobutyrate dehydrogenase-like beta-hydroxyacid dehydrogenase
VGAVGVIGLGQIGGPMAARLADWPGGLVVYDVVPEATAPLAEQGAIVADSVATLGGAVDLVSVMVRDDAQVRDVVAELLTTARPGTVIAIHSTIRAETAEELAPVTAAQGVALLDVPVSGGLVGAVEGTLAAIVGGDRAAYERARPVFERWATLVVHMGAVGAGTRTKLARNIVHYVAYTGAMEAQRLAEAAGLDLRTLAKVVRHSDGVTGGPSAIMVRDRTGELAPDDALRDIFVHTRDLAEKDLDLALELADQLGQDLPVTAHVRAELASALGVPHAS